MPAAANTGAGTGALAGIRVVDLSRILGGPLCGQILGDHGADVLKIEPPQGDDTRAWGPPFRDDGVASYYLVPSLGPFATSPEDFARLPVTGVSTAQAEYLVDRAHLLADPAAPDAFASISAFASLHTAFTCAILLVALYLRLRWLSAVMAAYLFLVVLATIYFGMHFVVDDVAGVAIAVVAVVLARLTVHWPHLDDRGRTG